MKNAKKKKKIFRGVLGMYSTVVLLDMSCTLQQHPSLHSFTSLFFFSLLLYILFLVLSLEISLYCTCSSDIFLSTRPRTGLATAFITHWVRHTLSVNVKNTHTRWVTGRRFHLVRAGPDCYRHYEYLMAGNIVYVPDDPSLRLVSMLVPVDLDAIAALNIKTKTN